MSITNAQIMGALEALRDEVRGLGTRTSELERQSSYNAGRADAYKEQRGHTRWLIGIIGGVVGVIAASVVGTVLGAVLRGS